MQREYHICIHLRANCFFPFWIASFGYTSKSEITGSKGMNDFMTFVTHCQIVL